MTDPSILIVGASGRQGSRVIRHLASRGVRARALVRTADRAQAVSAFATPVLGDLLRPDSLATAFDGVERVFVIGQPSADMEALERNAIDAAVSAGVRRIVYLSNFTARKGSPLPPNNVHGIHEALLPLLGVEWTILGPTRCMTYVPFNWESVLDDGVLLESSGGGIMTCIDPDDVAAVAAKVLIEDGHDGQIYRMSSDDAFTADELAATLARAIGRDVRVDPNAPVSKYAEMVAAGLFRVTDTAGKLLGRPPRRFADWLSDNLPAGLRATER